MAQKTAVEWLQEKYFARLGNLRREDFQQAKEMEKEQIINAHGTKVTHNIKMGMDVYEYKAGTEYYNETYGTE
jgi:hypothetical protein